MNVASHPSVPPFRSLGRGTVEHGQPLRNTPWNTDGTVSLKALAHKVLERNKRWNNLGTNGSNPVPPPPHSVPTYGTDPVGSSTDDLLYAFNERAAILEYDGGLSREEAERLARIDTEAAHEWLQERERSVHA